MPIVESCESESQGRTGPLYESVADSQCHATSILDVLTNVIDERAIDVAHNTSNPPELLYHYTTFGVWEALASGKADLCCTDFHELNDTREYYFGLKCIKRALKAHFENDKSNGVDELCKKFGEMASLLKGLDRFYLYSPWVFSLSAARDSLHQWVAYTDKNVGGVALGISRTKLEKHLEHFRANERAAGRNCHCELLPCLYVKQDGGFYINRCKVDFIKIFETLHDLFCKDKGEENGIQLVILLLASIIKDYPFADEDEWRVILQYESLGDLSLADVVGGKLRMPFLLRNADMMFDCVKEVMSAPHANLAYARRSLLFPQIRNKKWKYKLCGSKITYRG